ncbi:GNAT family N-acetyltransferase [Kitasatospora sp. NPDC093806]|uniref:GNAT family N-acetyltransferase n=1 Tax=Kitasatospora sp. NPDC093806 TaxID=3155075 RepID=UPI00342155E5
MIIRPTTPSDLDRVLPLLATGPAGGLTADTYRTRIASGEYRPAWTWIAEPDSATPEDTPLALAVWWGDPDDAHPSALDGLYVHDSVPTDPERTTLAADLLSAAHADYARAGLEAPADYHLVLPGDWREQPDTHAAVAWRQEAARRAGLPADLERLRYEWTPEAGLPAPSDRLHFTPEPDDEVFVDLFRRVLDGSLDAASRTEADRVGEEAQAREDVAFYRDTMLGDRTWWRVARTPDGEPVGFGLPSRNHASPVVGYLGVLPAHRGHGYATDILAEITRILATETTPTQIRADTDLTNTPMSTTLARLNYRNTTRRLVLSAE